MKYSKKEKLNNSSECTKDINEVDNTSSLTLDETEYIKKIVEDAYTNHKWLMDELSK